jgi:hypothetical protein
VADLTIPKTTIMVKQKLIKSRDTSENLKSFSVGHLFADAQQSVLAAGLSLRFAAGVYQAV